MGLICDVAGILGCVGFLSWLMADGQLVLVGVTWMVLCVCLLCYMVCVLLCGIAWCVWRLCLRLVDGASSGMGHVGFPF